MASKLYFYILDINFNEFHKSDIAKYEQAVHTEKLKNGTIIDKNEFKKKSFLEERNFFIKKIEETKEIAKIKKIENEELFASGKINVLEMEKRNKVNNGVAYFFQEKLKRVEHDLWIINKNKFDLIKYPIYY